MPRPTSSSTSATSAARTSSPRASGRSRRGWSLRRAPGAVPLQGRNFGVVTSPSDSADELPDDAAAQEAFMAMDEQGYRGPQVCKIVGITYRQLDYWARTDLLRPSISEARG